MDLLAPQHGLLLDSPLNGDVDMHAFGNGDPQLKDLWQAAAPEATAIEAQQQCDLVPDERAMGPPRHLMLPFLVWGGGRPKKSKFLFFLPQHVWFDFQNLTCQRSLELLLLGVLQQENVCCGCCD
jgi:hypothetical protein